MDKDHATKQPAGHLVGDAKPKSSGFSDKVAGKIKNALCRLKNAVKGK